MKEKILNCVESIRKFTGKHSPEILTGIGITGMISTVIFAVKATPRALDLIENKKEELNTDKLTAVETVKAAWKPYIPTTVMGVTSISCIVGASTMRYKRNAALATAYAISERTLTRYRDKVVETLGEKKEKEIRRQISQDDLNKRQTDSQVIITSNGNTLCMDAVTKRMFRSDMDTIKKAVNKLNRDLTYDHYVSLNEFYGEIGLEPTSNGDLIGWNLDNGLIEIHYDTCLAKNDEPCIVIDFYVQPRYDFDKLM
jgi:hypothetical protein